MPTFEEPDFLSFEENIKKKMFAECVETEMKKGDEEKKTGNKDLLLEFCPQSMRGEWVRKAASFDEVHVSAPQAPAASAQASALGDAAKAKKKKTTHLADGASAKRNDSSALGSIEKKIQRNSQGRQKDCCYQEGAYSSKHQRGSLPHQCCSDSCRFANQCWLARPS